MTAPRLIERLTQCADLWAEANKSSISRLGRLTVNDSSFFVSRTTSPKGVTTATLERFAQFLIDPHQWCGIEIPSQVVEFAHVVGITADANNASTGNAGQMSGGEAA
ncbi:pyridoxine/pyridoxamine 5'-phosphate oxidase [Novosphingobium sp. SG707]|nr:pyridoxine/pyridoxamine 5'-phosphate oxidase [Novosphingobium sp. SG707]